MDFKGPLQHMPFLGSVILWFVNTGEENCVIGIAAMFSHAFYVGTWSCSILSAFVQSSFNNSDNKGNLYMPFLTEISIRNFCHNFWDCTECLGKWWWGDVFGHSLKILFFTESKLIVLKTLNLSVSIGNKFNRNLYIV